MNQTPLAIADLTQQRASTDPHRACIRDAEHALTNERFHSAVVACAARLSGFGVSSGDTVAVMLPNCVELVVTMFAAWSLGAATTPVNPALTDDEVTYQLEDSASRVLVAEDRGGALASALDIHHVDRSEVLPSGDSPAGTPGPGPALDDFALIIYTSGTTGRPKGVLLDHANLTAMSDALIAELSLTEDDTSLLVLPLFHVNGLVVSVLATLRARGAVVVAPRFAVDSFWEIVETTRPTFFSAVPTIYALLDAKTDRAVDTTSLRFAICGAAPMPPELIGTIESRFGFPVVEGYGLSECSVAATLNPVAGPRKPGTVGRALPGQEVAIMGLDGELLPPGASGEVVIRGANVMRGYLGKPEVTATVVRDGWLHTGDVGRLDEDGYLVLVDRLKDMIIRGGENIYPKEIEDVIYRHPAVLETAVVGRPDPVMGEVPVAFVAPRPGMTIDPAEVSELCERVLAKYKRPVEVQVLPSLPKNSVGKIVKGFLRQRSRA